ncbi:6,7-dimethyl-8-ribityllumazine synthase [Rhodoblastus acidophilus]|uniref:6,7-dimethyl-8-ribityllumazine synthase n=1 Tax=Rhodoblastus acidophilus TaxID=1074 RepID=A0A212S7X9_RHOAC|nr:6,7-dimethyl-8-ribityllumazine synthase [Rhodoblastus acidophilus]MCW2318287.1 6,7-dimethyl-8-ribityllumazine synthase [Rhodoblastus acidophilus]PPQ37047.1 6,7-dimethyl-8-ribityllumazine synthase [Rhodoblastus acidophilus]RAI20354.1 6,7-dimethyl-8-ribityllumazine synthase [Rhodoblastus acidophilus]SNB81415.1 6,7-dimethyl-8-ribityllumazine synthase [Rhodoblastus acidophilus]
MAEPSRAPETVESVDGAHFLIIEARFYDAIGALQLAGAVRALEQAGARFTTFRAPGALEIPAAAAILLDAAEKSGAPYAGVIALGCVIRGETYHFEIVAGESARALMDLSVARKIPLGNGVLTTENEAQALERADLARLDKGGDAARAALAMYRLKREAR